MKILITGAAGFIGFHISKKLLDNAYQVIGIDNMNDYYDPSLKHSRLEMLCKYNNFYFYKADIKDKAIVDNVFKISQPTHVINLAAQAGVRYSIENPYAYIDSNIIGFMNILEACRSNPVEHFIYASSSSVYGGNRNVPFSTNHNVDHPVSLYAATKKSNELMAHSYSHLYNIPSTGLRFFTVYGPWGRPDMAYFLFTEAILKGKPIKIFNHGNMERDFTYIDDIVDGVCKLLKKPPKHNTKWDGKNNSLSESFAPYKIYNIGNNKPIKLMRFIEAIEDSLGMKAEKNYFDMQLGDVEKTFADINDLQKSIDFQPSVNIEKGIEKFVKWYKNYYVY